MGIMSDTLSFFQKPEDILKSRDKETIKTLIIAIIITAATYGICYGYLETNDMNIAVWYLLKFPGIYVLTCLFSMPTIYLIYKITGSKQDAIQMLSVLLLILVPLSITQIAMLPLNILYTFTGHDVFLIHMISIVLGCIIGFYYLGRGLSFIEKDSEMRQIILWIITVIIIIFVLVQFVDLFFTLPMPTYEMPIYRQLGYGIAKSVSIVD
ncbi:MAG: YIP1 family protein [Candidatus Parvarchaeota archaeon]|nr:YIP1 family protein [Candidatus Jingweiarchaeum tengchongense]MCW1297917.1 YIP1 family protein [Candidatus Jingweiarchaeum tengchongense]MCW1306038.1 YIP1 family protein [Candidatus Jingweiarchaeum tengchongense]MCW1311043.1 YIP1 family protein [Candidatus Jingweiarchaeum tengchongense]